MHFKSLTLYKVTHDHDFLKVGVSFLYSILRIRYLIVCQVRRGRLGHTPVHSGLQRAADTEADRQGGAGGAQRGVTEQRENSCIFQQEL